MGRVNLISLILLELAAGHCFAIEQLHETFDESGTTLPEADHVVQGNWTVRDGALHADAVDGEAHIRFGDASWRNFEAEVIVTFLDARDDSSWVALTFRAPREGGLPRSQFTVRRKATSKNGVEFAVRHAGGWSVRGKKAAGADLQFGRSHKLRVEVTGSNVRGYIDGQLVIENFLCVDRGTGCIGFAVSGCQVAFDDLTVTPLPDTPVETRTRRNSKPCDVVAHRGFSAVAPGNTLASIARAIEAGADGSEFDVRETKDGAVVLMHDATVDRTTNGKGEVAKLTLADLRKLDAGSWKSEAFRGERVPTLEEALKAMKRSGCHPVIEIKSEGISSKVVDAVNALDMADEVAVIAFNDAVVREIRALAPKIPCAWLTSEDLTGLNEAERAAWLVAHADACNTQILDVHFGMLSPAIIDTLHKNGIAVWTWTVDEPVIMETLMRWGVDSITTDRPDELRELREGG